MKDRMTSESPGFRLGIDLGGTKIEGVVLDSHANELTRLRVPTQAEDGYQAVLRRIGALYRDLQSAIEGAPHTLGIGTPGSISHTTGLLKNCNATQLNGKPLQDDLQHELGHNFVIENDANCFALAEAMAGAGRGHASVLGLVIGTGVGAGIVLNGRLLPGRHRVAGEWGHMVIDPSGPACYCGRAGCVERYISGTALQRQYLARTGERLALPQILERALDGETQASLLVDGFLDRFAHAVANVVAVLDPDVIVIGGGVASVDRLYTDGVERLARLVFNDAFDAPVLRNQLGNSAGVIGAALLGI